MWIGTLKLARPSIRESVLAGGVAATAYLAEMARDMRLVPNSYDDLVLWGGFLSRDPRRQRLLGAVVHYGLGIGLAAVYQAILPALPRLPGWLRGLIFAQAENTLSFPAVAVIDAIHPSVRSGELPPLFTWRYFWLEALRHAAYGAALGSVRGRPRGHEEK